LDTNLIGDVGCSNISSLTKFKNYSNIQISNPYITYPNFKTVAAYMGFNPEFWYTLEYMVFFVS
jgi:hypothetical protein